ncbi:MAG TPA: hypothetical protein VFR18_03640 [Terriglobia bacterium]|nr:hypothetical protein [Terriglobia bacterium]
MHPDLMRAVNFWVGILLRFLLTIVNRLRRLRGLAAPPGGAPRKTLGNPGNCQFLSGRIITFCQRIEIHKEKLIAD